MSNPLLTPKQLAARPELPSYFDYLPDGSRRHPAIVKLFERTADEYEVFSRFELRESKGGYDTVEFYDPYFQEATSIQAYQEVYPHLLATAHRHHDEKLLGEGKEPLYPDADWFYWMLGYSVAWEGNVDKWRVCYGLNPQDISLKYNVFGAETYRLDVVQLLNPELQNFCRMPIRITERQNALGVVKEEYLTVGALLNQAWYSYLEPDGPDQIEPQSKCPRIRKIRYPQDWNPTHAWELADGTEARKMLTLLSDVANHIFVELMRSQRSTLNLSGKDKDILAANTANVGQWVKRLDALNIPELSDGAALNLVQPSEEFSGFGPAGHLSKNGHALFSDRVEHRSSN